MTAPLTDAELAEIRALREAAPESIETEIGDPGPMGITASSADPIAACASWYAASRSAVPRLLDLIAHQRAALAVVEAERGELRREVESLRGIAAKATKLAASVETMMPALKTGWPRASQDLLDALDAYRKERP